MSERIMVMAASIVAGCIVMILHELPKSIYIFFKVKNDKIMIGSRKSDSSKLTFANVFKLWKYIDPIGLIFCLIFKAGFSKNDLEISKYNTLYNKKIGIIGFISLLIQFIASTLLLKYVFGMNKYFSISSIDNGIYITAVYVCTYTALISLGMMITNFFPISFFDSSLFISNIKSIIQTDTRRNDYKYLLILIIIYFTGIISTFCYNTLEVFLSFTL